MQQIHPHALFRLSVLGPLASRQHLEKGDLKALVRDLAAKSYAIPNSRRIFIGEKTIEGWYYAWKRGGIDALAPKQRSDRGSSSIPEPLQKVICAAKQENPGRSLRTIRLLVPRPPGSPAPGNSPAQASIACCKAGDSPTSPAAPRNRWSTGLSSPPMPATSGIIPCSELCRVERKLHSKNNQIGMQQQPSTRHKIFTDSSEKLRVRRPGNIGLVILPVESSWPTHPLSFSCQHGRTY